MKKHLFMLSLGALLMLPTLATAHTPIASCADNGDSSITCEAGFSDGSSAAGVRLAIYDSSDQKLYSGRLNENSEYTFDKPNSDYKVIFDAGGGHKIEIEGKNIVQ